MSMPNSEATAEELEWQNTLDMARQQMRHQELTAMADQVGKKAAAEEKLGETLKPTPNRIWFAKIAEWDLKGIRWLINAFAAPFGYLTLPGETGIKAWRLKTEQQLKEDAKERAAKLRQQETQLRKAAEDKKSAGAGVLAGIGSVVRKLFSLDEPLELVPNLLTLRGTHATLVRITLISGGLSVGVIGLAYLL